MSMIPDDDKEQTPAPAAPEPPALGIIADETALDPVEVDIESGVSGAPEKAIQEERVKKQPGRYQQRIDKLTRDNMEKQTAAERLAAENEELKQREVQLVARSQETDRAAMIHYEARIEAELKIAKSEMAAAIDSGDAARQTEAQAAVSKLASEQATIERWKSNNQPRRQATQAPQAPQAPQAQQQVAPQTPQPLSQEFSAWVSENPWFMPNTPEFDQDMHQESVLFGRKLERQFIKEGRSDEIGTPDYWAEITSHMRSEYPDAFGEEEAAPAPKKSTPFQKQALNGTTPATRSGVSGSSAQGNPNKVTLSGDERKMAHNLASSGALLGDRGQRLTSAEAEIRFAQQKMNIQKRGA